MKLTSKIQKLECRKVNEGMDDDLDSFDTDIITWNHNPRPKNHQYS